MESERLSKNIHLSMFSLLRTWEISNSRSLETSLGTMEGRFLCFVVIMNRLASVSFNLWFCSLVILFGFLLVLGSSLVRTKWCRLLLVVRLLMKSVLASLKSPRLCSLLLTMDILYYYLAFFYSHLHF